MVVGEKKEEEKHHFPFLDSTHACSNYHTTMSCFSTPFGTAGLPPPR